MKFLLVSGGTISTLGKGIAASSVSLLLQQSGLRVTNIKIDPYLNVDAALFRPLEHGETYVLASGGEVDLDLGNYERFCDIELTKAHSITAGKLYKGVLDRERAGAYLGKTVQVIPHLTDYCQELIEEASRVPVDKSGCQPDVCVIELGGVITDLESAVFVESLRTLKYRVGSDNFAHIHINLVPIVGSDSEQKSKPTQTAVKSLMQQGLGPDLIFCRCAHKLQSDVAKKIAFFAMIPQTGVVSMHDLPNIMHVPQILLDQNVPALIHNVLRFNKPALVKMPELWRSLTQRLDLLDSAPQSQQNAIKIALVGKYVELQDAYLSIKKSLLYVSIHINKKIDILWIDASHLDATTKEQNPDVFNKAWEELKSAHGVIIPGGFGTTGIAGKLLAIHYCRVKKVPMLGICLGFQLAVIEFCQNVLKVDGATSEEFDPASKTTVIAHMDDLDDSKIMGGTMRLGNTTVLVAQNSLLHYLYGSRVLVERHRHRYEVNPQYVDRIQANGGRFTGCDPTRTRMECFELDYQQHQHPFYFCVQYHPEFTSRVMAPNPCFVGLALAAAKLFTLPIAGKEEEVIQRSSVLPPLQLRPISPQQASEGGQPQFEWDPTSNIKNTMDIDLAYYEKDDSTQLHAATPSNGGKKTKPALILPTHFFIPE